MALFIKIVLLLVFISTATKIYLLVTYRIYITEGASEIWAIDLDLQKKIPLYYGPTKIVLPLVKKANRLSKIFQGQYVVVGTPRSAIVLNIKDFEKFYRTFELLEVSEYFDLLNSLLDIPPESETLCEGIDSIFDYLEQINSAQQRIEV